MFKIVSNALGKIFDYGSCPNCDDSWRWKESEEFVFEIDEDGTQRSIAICTDCLANPSGLDAERMGCNVNRHRWKWKRSKIRRIKAAIVEYQKQAVP